MMNDPGSSVMQEIVAETQAERNNRDNESHFGEQPAEQNSYPVDSRVTHFYESFSILLPFAPLPRFVPGSSELWHKGDLFRGP